MTSLDLDLIDERNAQLLHDVRAERLRGRLRAYRGSRSGAGRIARLVETRRMFGLLAGTRWRIDEVAREA
jgi:hypothetical protein